MAAYYKTGLHVGVCVGQFMGQSDNANKTPYFALKFNIRGRVEDEREIPVDQGERTVYLYLSEKALDMSVDVVAFLGYDKDSLKFLNPEVDGFYDFSGKEVDLWCKIEEYQGKDTEKWSVSMPRKPVTPIEDKELRRLDSLFGKAIRARRGPGVPDVAPPPAAPAKSGNGEIPGVSPQQTRAASRSKPEAPPTQDEIPF
jgi:hypothetical protein